MDATPAAEKKKSRRVFGGSRSLARRNLAKNKAKFAERTGQSVASVSAASNTERALENGGRAAAERLLKTAIHQRDGAIEQREAEKQKAEESTRELVRELTCEKDAAVLVERERRIEAEEEKWRAVRAKERAMEKEREAKEKALKMKAELKAELRALHAEKKKLAAKKLRLCREAGFAGGSVEVEAEEGSTRCIEEELELERFRVARLERRMAVLQPRVDG